MNPKVQKITNEIEKMKSKISDMQAKLRYLQQQKTELENADILAMIRSINVPPEEFGEFVRLFKEQQKTAAVPDMAYDNKEDAPIEE